MNRTIKIGWAEVYIFILIIVLAFIGHLLPELRPFANTIFIVVVGYSVIIFLAIEAWKYGVYAKVAKSINSFIGSSKMIFLTFLVLLAFAIVLSLSNSNILFAIIFTPFIFLAFIKWLRERRKDQNSAW